MAILVTGGAGYIGSHTCIELVNAGYDVVVLDNLCNSSKESLKRVEKIVGKPIPFYEADIRDAEALKNIFEKEDIDAVIHFAGLKAVGESVVKPLEYYDNNIAGTLVLCDAMRRTLSSVLLQQYMEIRHLYRSQKNARKDSVQTHTAGRSQC